MVRGVELSLFTTKNSVNIGDVKEEHDKPFVFDVSGLCTSEMTVLDGTTTGVSSCVEDSQKRKTPMELKHSGSKDKKTKKLPPKKSRKKLKSTRKVRLSKDTMEELSPEQEVSCDHCQKTFIHKRLLYNHIRNVHIEGRPFVCPNCAKGFKTQHSLNEHMETHNPNRENFPCDICSKVFQTKGSLINHMKKHNKEYIQKCHLCGQQFVSVKDFKSHVKTKHSESFLCTYCGKSFASCYSLNYHVQKHDPNFQKGNMKCDFCDQVFDTWRVKRDHMRLRHGDVERVHCCDICGKRFLRQNALQWHTNTHTGEKPYKCNFCPRGFTEPKSLKRHALTAHQIARAFVCSYCEEAFESEALLTEHLKAKHIPSEDVEK